MNFAGARLRRRGSIARRTAGMSGAYHITVFDNFHRGDPDACWVAGTYATAEEAIAGVKRRVDQELEHFWSELCRQNEDHPTLDELMSQYDFFAETPVAFDSDGKMIFDTAAYMKSRATEMIVAADAKRGP
jgi:hypothetical protein